MIRSASLVAAALVWSFSAVLVWAQANPLEVIPDDALGFAVIHDLSDANARVSKLTQKMQLPLPDLLSTIKGYVGVDEGVDETGGLAFAAVSGGEGKEVEGMAYMTVVPTTDYKALLAPLDAEDADADVTKVTVAGQTMYVGHKGDFAVFASETAREQLAAFLAAKTNVTQVVEPLKSWLAEQHAAIVITPIGKKLLFQSIAAALPDAAQLKKDAGLDDDADDEDDDTDDDADDDDTDDDDRRRRRR